MPALDLAPDPHPIRTRAIMLNSGMLIQVIPGDRPMRLDRVERATHNGRTCLVLHGMQATRGGRVHLCSPRGERISRGPRGGLARATRRRAPLCRGDTSV